MTDVSIPQDAIATMKCCGQNRFSVQDLLAAIAEVQELIRNVEQEAAETVDNNGNIPGQIAMVGFFHPLTSHSRICTIYGG